MCKTTTIYNRRYLGNKYKLLPFIKSVAEENCQNAEIVADLFAGTGAVASSFQNKQLITNDILYSNYICNLAWFSSEEYNANKINNIISDFNRIDTDEDNYMSETFADTFFSRKDCQKIGTIREEIDLMTDRQFISDRERAILISSLLYAMDKIAKTCGHYDAYRKGVEFDTHLELAVPIVFTNNNINNKCFNEDINQIASKIKADLVYLDPPYNSRQYCDAYHVLENVAKWKKPKVEGIARKMNRDHLKSDYCTQKATNAFDNLIKKIDAKYILLSYNNMEKKGNDRSNAKISDNDIKRILSNKGELKIFEKEYKAFSTGLSNIKDNKERLFLCCVNK